MSKLFRICQRFLLFLGRAARLSYVEISVIFNLWVQGGLLAISAFIPLIVLLSKGIFTHLILVVVFTIYALLFLTLYILMLVHYKLPFSRAFDSCVEDLQKISSKLHLTYQTVNIIIFVIAFLALLFFNIAITFLIMKL